MGRGRPLARRHADPSASAAAQKRARPQPSRWGSGGWRRCTAARRDDLEIAPNLWAGFGLVRGGAGTALVGSHDEVADRIAEYHALGFDEFILSGYPHLEEAYWFGEGVMPRLRDAGLLAGRSPRDVRPAAAPGPTAAPAPAPVLAPASAS